MPPELGATPLFRCRADQTLFLKARAAVKERALDFPGGHRLLYKIPCGRLQGRLGPGCRKNRKGQEWTSRGWSRAFERLFQPAEAGTPRGRVSVLAVSVFLHRNCESFV